MRFTYPNGYGVSVIRSERSYGAREGKYELGVLHGDRLCYATPITSDVIGWLDEDEVREISLKVAQLAPNPRCTHGRSKS